MLLLNKSELKKNTVVGKRAVIGNNVRIGNFSTIEDDVVIGDNCWIGNNVSILNGTRIGKDCQIHSGAVLGGVPQDLKYEGENTLLEIGNNNIIREFVTINRGTSSKGKTIIGNNCIIGFSVGMAGEVVLGDWVNISGLTAIHQFSLIGDHTMISGLSRIVKDIPPYITAGRDPLSYVGLNIVGLKRRGFESEKINELKEIYKILFLERRNTTFAVELIESLCKPTMERDRILTFIKESKRGIIKGFND